MQDKQKKQKINRISRQGLGGRIKETEIEILEFQQEVIKELTKKNERFALFIDVGFGKSKY